MNHLPNSQYHDHQLSISKKASSLQQATNSSALNNFASSSVYQYIPAATTTLTQSTSLNSRKAPTTASLKKNSLPITPSSTNNNTSNMISTLYSPSPASSNNHLMNNPMFMVGSATSMHNSSSTLTFSSSSSSDDSSNNQNLANLLSNLMSLNPQSPTSILLDKLTNNSSLSSQQQKQSTTTSTSHVHYPSTSHHSSQETCISNQQMLNNALSKSSFQFPPNHHHQQHVEHPMEQQMYFPTSTTTSSFLDVCNNTLKSFEDQTWSCMEKKSNSSLLIKPLSPSSFTLFQQHDDNQSDLKNSNDLPSPFPLEDVKLADLFQNNSNSMYGIKSFPETQTSELIVPMEYSNNDLLQKQQIVDYYSSLLQSRFKQVFGNVIELDQSNHQMISTQQFVYYDNPSSFEQNRKPLNLKLDLSESDVDLMRSLLGKQNQSSNHNHSRKSIQSSRKNSISSSGSYGKQITKSNKTKGSPSRKGRKCQAVPNNFSPLNEETGNWRFFSYNGDVKEPFSLDQEESQSKLVFYKFNPVK